MIPSLHTPAPAFSLPDQNGTVHSLESFKGKWLLLYFYPKDDTPGCTTEACNFRDGFQEFKDKGIEIVGVSTDPVKSHQKFSEKYQLPFTLLADTEKKTVNEYGVWVTKSMYGKEYMGIARTTFLIDPDGMIQKVYENVKPAEHGAEILKDFGSL